MPAAPSYNLPFAVSVQSERLTVAHNQGGRVGCDPPFSDEVTRFMTELQAAIAHYPKASLQKIGLRKIVLCRDLSWRFARPVKRVVNGATDIRKSQAIAAFAQRGGTLYFDIARLIRSRAIAQTTHHELFHLIQGAYPRWRNLVPDWSKANPPGFKYGTGGMDMQDSYSTGIQTNTPGFITTYATSALEEDQAELYANWMQHKLQVESLAKKDAHLQKKLQLLTEVLTRLKIPTP